MGGPDQFPGPRGISNPWSTIKDAGVTHWQFDDCRLSKTNLRSAGAATRRSRRSSNPSRRPAKLGIPVVEYNFYAHRAIEGYFAEDGRGGAGLTGMNYTIKVESAAAARRRRAHLDEMWDNITYFLKAVIPPAEKANVRLALHPNDPPVPLSRGSRQIMGTVEGWKKLISIVDSPSNGITFECGVSREMGHDPVEVCRYFGTRDRINHVHYRNPIVECRITTTWKALSMRATTTCWR